MNFGLSEKVITKIQQVFESNSKVDKAFVFGSRAKGNFKEGSDIDIAIKGQELDFKDILSLSGKLEDLDIPYKVDLLDYHSIKELALKEHIDRVGIELYSRWKDYILENIIKKFIDYRGKTPSKTISGIPLVTAKIIKNGKIIEPNEFIAEKDYKSWMTRGFPEINDIVLTTEAPLGEVALIKNKNVALAQRIITLQTKKEICNSIFLKYYLESSEGQYALQSRSSGSTVEGIKSAELKKMIVHLPPLPEQTAIASILSSLDDKINLLQHQNKTLGQLAETLFRQWFVEEAEESWEEKRLFDVIELVGGGTPKTEIDEYWNGNIKWLSCGDITANHKRFVMNSEKSITELGLQNSSSKLLPKYSTIISARGTVGKYCLLAEPMAFSQSNYGITPKIKDCWFFTHLLVAHSVNELQSAAYGSVFDTITTNTFKGLKVSLPEAIKIIQLEEKLKPYFVKILSNQTQIRTITKLRDTLLPKLMSGEVRVKM